MPGSYPKQLSVAFSQGTCWDPACCQEHKLGLKVPNTSSGKSRFGDFFFFFLLVPERCVLSAHRPSLVLIPLSPASCLRKLLTSVSSAPTHQGGRKQPRFLPPSSQPLPMPPHLAKAQCRRFSSPGCAGTCHRLPSTETVHFRPSTGSFQAPPTSFSFSLCVSPSFLYSCCSFRISLFSKVPLSSCVFFPTEILKYPYVSRQSSSHPCSLPGWSTLENTLCLAKERVQCVRMLKCTHTQRGKGTKQGKKF